MRVLIVEDNPDIAANTGDYLELLGHEVDFAADGLLGANLIAANDYDVIVLDVMLPRLSGLTLCRQIKDGLASTTPVLMLTAKDTLEDKVAGFEAGADDYLVKPFALKELVMRLDALTRRRSRPEEDSTAELQVADLVFNLRTLRASRAGREVKLNPMQRLLLQTLMENAGEVVHKERLERLLDEHGRDGNDTLRAHIYALRRAIDKPFDRPLLQTVHGAGYRLTTGD